MSLPQSTNHVVVFGVKLSILGMEETVEYLVSSGSAGRPVIREDLNAFKVCMKEDSFDVKDALNNADIVNADGMSVVYAVKLLKGLKIPRVTGCDLFARLLAESHKREKRVFLLGAKEEVVRALTHKLAESYSAQLIAGFRNGYFQRAEWGQIIEAIDTSNADFLFIGTPSPQKEEFLNYARTKIKRHIVIMGVGGSFDVLSGEIRRAPTWMQNYGLEWLFRLAQEPRRMWRRYLLSNSKFALLLLQEKLQQWISK
ncbi:WecB/TagA/CpsF family glycosyltransferase [Pseudomonas sp. L-22-4S-12]|uniref:WecB/TagA/CpsF family glycosyltransferase n=1 Tax=Pseudomonas sp. L-22-4S-12 TaxID=2610893 RepID=UPI00132AFD7C|nr:WecB/TagA/CpsF family glycosyltransferase [Pseudomonas sp. L-22-4S-12]MWV15958.1 WecB/TagA/CpsF family glycosyltransferase [Pseudomonas sp. L-22-4S-12]